MKTFLRPGLTAVCLAGLLLSAPAQERQASLKADRVNVRGEATLQSEVITQLREGEMITVLEEITLEKPGPGEPAKWARVLLPSNTPVWVHKLFIDPDTRTVKASKLNVRAGPGENFSVVGQLANGASVREIRTVGDWMEIEPPSGTYAYVAAEFLQFAEPAPMLADKPAKPATLPAVEPAPEAVKPAMPAKPAPTEPVVPVETVNVEAPPAVATASQPKPVTLPPPPAPPAEPIVAPPPTEAAPPPVVAKPTPKPVTLPEVEIAPAPPATPAPDEPPPKRVVEREGIVKRSWSIQAPSPYLLADPQTGQTVNYLYTADTGLQLKYYVGRHIRVSGPEALDSRWKTPLLKIETLQTLP
jgi:uncharacterized protein YgiM (DUF1202 family)